MNIASLAEDNTKRLGECISHIFEGERLINVHSYENARRLSSALTGLGVGGQEVVAISMSNCPEVLESFTGTFHAGAIVLPILYLLSEDEVRFILENSGAAAVITDTTLEQKMLSASADVETVRHVIVVGGQGSPQTMAYEALLQESSPNTGIAPRLADDLAMIMYTSGTTALPKGVMLSHGNLLGSAISAHEASELSEPTSNLLCLPLAHIFGVGALNTGLLNEFRETIGVILRWFDPDEVFRAIEEYRIDSFPGVPTMFAMLLDHPAADRFDLSSLADCLSGGSPLPVELRSAFMEKFNCNMRELYGLTESAGMGAMIRPSHPYREGTVGKSYPNHELAIFDNDDNELPPGELGEVVMRGPAVMKGYLGLPEETEKTLWGGWLHTGDIGSLDDEGFLYITDRKKDIIIKGGENIMPAQIEEVLCKHPAVGEAAVVGVDDSLYGQEIVAFVTLKPSCEATSKELLDFACDHLSKFKRPREVHVLESLPKSSIGKTLKRELVSTYAPLESKDQPF